MNIKSLAIAVLATATLASPAAALTVVQDKTFDALAAGVATSFTFEQFDTSLGTLDSVMLDFTFLMPDVSGTVTNTGRNARSFAVNGSATGGVAGTGFALSDTSATVSRTTAVIASNGTAGVGAFGGAGGDSSTLTGDLSAFLGDGALAYNFTRAANFALVPSGQGNLAINPLVSGRATLTYNYTAVVAAATGAVPEPATWALMIMGFGAAGAVLRRRRPVAYVA